MKIAEGHEVKMSSVGVDCAIGGFTDDLMCAWPKKDVSPLDSVGQLYAMDGAIKQMSFISDKHYADLQFCLDDLPAKLTAIFLELLDSKHSTNFWVAIHVPYTYPAKDRGNTDTIVLHSGTNKVTSPLLLVRKLDSLIDNLRESQINFTHYLSGLGFDDILKTDLQLAKYLRHAGLKFR